MPTPLRKYLMEQQADLIVLKDTVIDGKMYSKEELEEMAWLEQYYIHHFLDSGVKIVIANEGGNTIRVPRRYRRYVNPIVLERASRWYRKELRPVYI